MTEAPTPSAAMLEILGALYPGRRPVAFDIRVEEGVPAIIEVIRSKLDAEFAVGLWDSDGVMPAFALARTAGAYVVTDGDEVRGSFATVEAALKHGLTMWSGYRHGR